VRKKEDAAPLWIEAAAPPKRLAAPARPSSIFPIDDATLQRAQN
jgi:hypothetical protein